MSCCSPPPSDSNSGKQETAQKASCCGGATSTEVQTKVHTKAKTASGAHQSGCCDKPAKRDYLLWGSLIGVVILYGLSFFELPLMWLHHASHAVFELMNTMAWGLAFGVVMVALLAYVPKEWVVAILGTHKGLSGLLRATGAGLLLDLCSHGILMVGAKLYERGASLGQVMAFLIASPWNSFSLTLILIALIGWQWTLTFIVLSAIVAIIAGALFDGCVTRGVLPTNPNSQDLPADFKLWPSVKTKVASIRLTGSGLLKFLVNGLKESRMVIRWLLFGVLLAAGIRTFVPEEVFGDYFGPTLLGLSITILVATVLEVCSEGSTPIAADIFNRAGAPGNSFAFLMAGVATDYTEVMVIKSTTRSWRIALFLPLLILPQVVVLAVLLNGLA